MNFKRLELFKIFGFPIRIDLTWLLILGLTTYSLAKGYFPEYQPGLPAQAYWSLGLVTALGLFASILFHELSHSLVARFYKIPISGITLFIFGGVAEMEEEPKSPKEEFLMAIVGPLASFLLAGVFFGLHLLITGRANNEGLALLFFYLAVMNGLLGTFNLIPAFPLDGGRVFRSIWWAIKKDYNQATKVAANLGKVFAYMMMMYGAWVALHGGTIGGFWYLMIGFFLRRASEMSLQTLQLKKVLEQTPASRLMQNPALRFSLADRLLKVGQELTGGVPLNPLPVFQEERLVGSLSLHDLNDMQPELWERGLVSDVVNRNLSELTLDPQTNAWEALQKMRRSKVSNLFIVAQDHFLGVVSAQQLLSYFKEQA